MSEERRRTLPGEGEQGVQVHVCLREQFVRGLRHGESLEDPATSDKRRSGRDGIFKIRRASAAAFVCRRRRLLVPRGPGHALEACGR